MAINTVVAGTIYACFNALNATQTLAAIVVCVSIFQIAFAGLYHALFFDFSR